MQTWIDRFARHLGVAFQILNEPSQFFALHPRDYVRYFLAPVARDLRDATLTSSVLRPNLSPTSS